MIETEPKVTPEGLYSVTQTAIILGVNRQTIRRYANNGDLKFEIRKATLRKVIKGSEILRFWRSTIV